MDIVHRTTTERQAKDEMIDFMRKNLGCGKQMKVVEYKKMVYLGDDVHYFMGDCVYFKWCKGRTYYDEKGVKYSSGYVISE